MLWNELKKHINSSQKKRKTKMKHPVLKNLFQKVLLLIQFLYMKQERTWNQVKCFIALKMKNFYIFI